MPEQVQTTLTVNDDGTIDIREFSNDPHLSKVKGIIDGLRRENAGHRDRVKELEGQVPQIDSLKAQVAELEGKANMTDTERRELEELRAKVEAYGDLDPEDARTAIDYRARTEKEKELARAFKAAGFNGTAALKLEGIRSLETRLETETIDGESVERAQVKVNGEWRPLDKYVEAEYSDFLTVLKPSDGGPTPTGGAGGKTPSLPAKNPWKRETRNLTEQARIQRENPELAERLKAAARE